MIKLTANSCGSSRSSAPTVPTKKKTFPIDASTVSEATLWISLMSPLIRETISPNEVRA